MTDEMPIVNFRVPEDLLKEIDRVSEKQGVSRSTIIRQHIQHGLAASHDIEKDDDIEEEIERIIGKNQQLRECLPSEWRAKLEQLYGQHIRNDYSPADMELMADAYRRQAEAKERLAETVPLAPEADLVGIVDDMLMQALEAGDLSNWYDGIDNRYERRFEGVDEGSQERDHAIRIIEQVVRKQERAMEALETDDILTASADDLPAKIDSELPDDLSRMDIVQMANHCLRNGIDPDDVASYLPKTNPNLQAGDTTDYRRNKPEADQSEIDTDTAGNPEPVAAIERQQRELIGQVEADGGRHPDSVPSESEKMSRNPQTDDRIELELPESIEDIEEGR